MKRFTRKLMAFLTAALLLTVLPLSVSAVEMHYLNFVTESLPGGKMGAAYSANIEVETCAVIDTMESAVTDAGGNSLGTLSALGLSLKKSGDTGTLFTVSGTPTQSGTFTVLVTLSGYHGEHIESGFVSNEKEYTLVIDPADVLYTFQVYKEDPNGKRLSGGVFQMKKPDSGTVVGTATSNAKGEAAFQLPAGVYALTESKAPSGYVKSGETYYVFLSPDWISVATTERGLYGQEATHQASVVMVNKKKTGGGSNGTTGTTGTTVNSVPSSSAPSSSTPVSSVPASSVPASSAPAPVSSAAPAPAPARPLDVTPKTGDDFSGAWLTAAVLSLAGLGLCVGLRFRKAR